MRKFRSWQGPPSEPNAKPTLRTDKPAAIYARRSDPDAKDEKKDKSQSRDMQTEDMISWAVNIGWKEENLEPYFKDLGLSGTLRPDQRPDMLKLFDTIESGTFDDGSVICYQESRLFRDETQIYYNQFIDLCKRHNIVVVVVSPYTTIYDFRDDFLTEMFRWKCKESAEFIKRQIKGWMHPARYRAAWNDGEWAGLGNLPAGYIVDYNEQSQTYKKLVPYWPHAEKKCEMRLLFVELGCNISLLYKKLRESPIIFPAFESWIDPRNISKFILSKHPGGGYYPKDKATIKGMLTDPHDIGYRPINGVLRHDRNGEKIIDHQPIVERELFDLVYFSLAETDLDGNPLPLKEEKKVKRYFHQGTKDAFGLLKFRIRSSQGYDVDTHSEGEYDGDTHLNGGSYVIQSLEAENSLRHYISHAVIPCEEIDMIIVDRLLEYVHEMSQDQNAVAEYEKQARQTQEHRKKKLVQIEKSTDDIDKEQVGLTRSLGKVALEIEEAEDAGDAGKKALKKRRQQLIEEEIETLEIERMRLMKVKEDIDKVSEGDLGSLNEEIKKLESSWPDYLFEKQRSLINFLVKEVSIDLTSTHWMRVEVVWLHEEWGREEMYYFREFGSNRSWKTDEDCIVRNNYEKLPREQLMALLPERGWSAIMARAYTLGIKRQIRETVKIPRILSHTDVAFIQHKHLSYDMRRTKWERWSKLFPHHLTRLKR